MLKPSLQLRLGQRLTMTQQLQQAIRLLQLSSLELKAAIQEAYESNPMLETEDRSESEAPLNENADALEEPGEATPDKEDPLLPEERAVESEWDDMHELSYTMGPSHTNEEQMDYLDSRATAEHGSLHDHLLWQLELSSLSDQDLLVAGVLINALDESGYLHEDLENIQASLGQADDIGLDEIEATLKFVQRLDPVGCGARSLQECLDVQLQQMPGDLPFQVQARAIVEKHLDLVGMKDYAKLSKRSGFSIEDIENAVGLIQTLHPKPGDLIHMQKSEYIVPDVYVEKHGNAWRVRLNPYTTPKLSINNVYTNMINKMATGEADYMRSQLQEARWLIKSVQRRNQTLVRVATSIIEHQQAFFEYGEEAMQPLVLRDIADELEMHESTISRITTNKYMDSPRGVFEFKYFFSSHVATNDGGACSAIAIKAMIKSLVQEENQAKPLSDHKIAGLLEQKGISVARRTIAKYRESLAIPPSNQRRQRV